jgi:histidine triad (HIT) family protein
VPKQHIKSFAHTSPQLMANMTEFIHKLIKTLDIDKGYRLITNIGEDGGQEIEHLHFHILSGEKLTHIYKR